jgi:hypothetical protein
LLLLLGVILPEQRNELKALPAASLRRQQRGEQLHQSGAVLQQQAQQQQQQQQQQQVALKQCG